MALCVVFTTSLLIAAKHGVDFLFYIQVATVTHFLYLPSVKALKSKDIKVDTQIDVVTNFLLKQSIV